MRGDMDHARALTLRCRNVELLAETSSPGFLDLHLLDFEADT